jgi:type VI secretion system protein ImpA
MVTHPAHSTTKSLERKGMKTFSRWAEAISAEEPSGVNIEYDSRYLELQNAAEGKPEQQYGNTVIPAVDPDWTLVEKLCIQLLSESKDLRLFSYYTQALTVKYGLPGFEAGVEAIKINLENFWESIFPQLVDEDGEFDPFYRANALSFFATYDGILKELLNAQLLINGLTQQPVTLKQALAVLQNNEDAQAYAGGRDRLLLDIRIHNDSGKTQVPAVRNSLLHLQKIIHIFTQKISEENLIDFSNLINSLQSILDIATEGINVSINDTNHIPNNPEEIGMPSPEKANIHAQHNVLTDNWRGLNLQARKDVDLVLEKICIYFENYEPSHPAPLFIRRVQRLMNMDFYEIMQDINPESLTHLEVLIGKANEIESITD